MMIRWARFNIYFALGLIPALLVGCRTEEGRKLHSVATLHLHMEIARDSTGRGTEVPVFRAHPVKLMVDKVPFLSESGVKEAKLVEGVGGFAIQIQFDKEAAMLLEQYTSANPTKHIVVFCQFGEPPKYKLNSGRWLAAPKIANRITDGVLTFTPDATREETERIVMELNNVAAKGEHGGILNW